MPVARLRPDVVVSREMKSVAIFQSMHLEGEQS